jgi:hypothetical protein
MIQPRPAGGTPAPLILDFLQWLRAGPRPYAEAMEAWRTSCPRLTVWEDAIDAGYVARERVAGGQAMVVLTPLGRGKLNARHPPGSPPRW